MPILSFKVEKLNTIYFLVNLFYFCKTWNDKTIHLKMQGFFNLDTVWQLRYKHCQMEFRKQKKVHVQTVKFFTFSNSHFLPFQAQHRTFISMTLVAVYQFGSSFDYSGLAYKPRIPQTLQHWTIYILVSVGFWCLWSVASCRNP